MVSCFSYGDTVLVEPYVEGVEVAVSVVDLGDGPVALPAVEIEPCSGVFDYASRYTAGTTTYHTPARLAPLWRRGSAGSPSGRTRALGLRDLSRADAIVTPAGAVQVLEVNVSPGMTETSLLPMAVEAAGLELGILLRDLIDLAIDRGGPRPSRNGPSSRPAAHSA